MSKNIITIKQTNNVNTIILSFCKSANEPRYHRLSGVS